MRRPVLIVADSPKHVVGRLASAYKAQWAGFPHDVTYSEFTHPFAIRQRARRYGLIYWVDQLAFCANPSASPVPQIVMVHHLTSPELKPTLARLPHADAIATASRRWQAEIGRLTGRRVWLVPYTLDTATFSVPDDRARFRADLGLAAQEYVLGFCAKAKANAFGRKGISLFLDVVAAARARWNDVTVLLIGEGWESVVPTIAAMGVRPIHRVPETTEHTASLYPAMDVFVCTSIEEGGPCTILEAMACGVPAVTTDVGHVPETIDDGRDGFIARERTIEPFIAAIARLRSDAMLRARVIAAARERVVAERSHERVLPTIDYPGIYAEAAGRFAARSWASRMARRLRLSLLAGRYGVRRSIQTIGG